MKTAVAAIVLIAIITVLWVSYRYGGITNVAHFEIRQRRLLRVCREMRRELEKQGRFEFVSVHIAKEPADITVEGFVGTPQQSNYVQEVISHFRARVSVVVNVQVDTNATSRPLN